MDYRIQVNISQTEVEEYCLDFYDMPKDSLDMIREGIYEVLEMAEEEPELADDPRFMEDLVRAFTMRQSLMQLNKLYDS